MNSGRLVIGGEVIVKGTGPQHTAQLTSNVTSGTVIWRVVNGICFYSVGNITTNNPADGGTYTIASGMPTANPTYYEWFTTSGNVTKSDGNYLGQLRIVKFNATPIYGCGMYAVADEWDE